MLPSGKAGILGQLRLIGKSVDFTDFRDNASSITGAIPLTESQSIRDKFHLDSDGFIELLDLCLQGFDGDYGALPSRLIDCQGAGDLP